MKLQGEVGCRIRLINCTVKSAGGNSFVTEGKDTLITVDGKEKEFICEK